MKNVFLPFDSTMAKARLNTFLAPEPETDLIFALAKEIRENGFVWTII